MKKVLLTFGIITASGIFLSASTSALTYQESVDVKFTFNPTVNISLSSADLIISNLAPGNYADSNIIDVIVSTNNETGYTLYATAGDGTTYTNTNLINGSNNFSSVSTSADLPSMNNASDNEWAYSFSTNSGSTWSNYSGLPYYTQTGKTLFATNTNTPITVNFKIGAKASSAQPSGTYRNIVNFIAVTNPMPPEQTTMSQAFANAGKTQVDGYYQMQDMNSTICANTTVTGEDSQTQLIDTRDDKVYWVAKLADGNCWMTQNLDHDIGDISGGTYSPSNTDVPSSWTPSSSYYTHPTNDTTWNAFYEEPESYDPGDLCWDGTISSSGGALVACTNRHYHIGNYYNWTASIATNDSSEYYTDDTDINQSICPAGWALSKGGSSTGSGSFAYLAAQANLTAGTSGNVHLSPYYFVYGGYWYGGYNNRGGGVYTTSIDGGGYIYILAFNYSGTLNANNNNDARDCGLSIRCVAR